MTFQIPRVSTTWFSGTHTSIEAADCTQGSRERACRGPWGPLEVGNGPHETGTSVKICAVPKSNPSSEGMSGMKKLRYSLALSLSFLISQVGWSQQTVDKQRLAEQIVSEQEAPGRLFHPEFRRRAVKALTQRP